VVCKEKYRIIINLILKLLEKNDDVYNGGYNNDVSYDYFGISQVSNNN